MVVVSDVGPLFVRIGRRPRGLGLVRVLGRVEDVHGPLEQDGALNHRRQPLVQLGRERDEDAGALEVPPVAVPGLAALLVPLLGARALLERQAGYEEEQDGEEDGAQDGGVEGGKCRAGDGTVSGWRNSDGEDSFLFQGNLVFRFSL